MTNRNYYNDIANIYSRIIKESPDNIIINDRYYSYDSTDGAYTGLIGSNGEYVVTDAIVGHGNLISFIINTGVASEDHSEIPSKLITNVNSLHGLNFLARNKNKIRIWSHQKVYSLWEDYDPKYEQAIKNSIAAIGHDFWDYKYDNEYKDYKDMPSADEFFVSELSDEEKESIEAKKRQQLKAERMMADKLAGIERKTVPSIDYDILPPKRKQNYWES